MIVTVAHLSDRSQELSPLHVAAAANTAPTQVARRLLVIHTRDDARSGDQICHEAITGGRSTVATAVVPTARAMHTMLPRLRDHYDDIVIEVEGVDSPLVRTALALCEQVVVPVVVMDDAESWSVPDAEHALREFMMTVTMARHHNARLAALATVDHSAPAWLTDLVSTHDEWSVQVGLSATAMASAS